MKAGRGVRERLKMEGIHACCVLVVQLCLTLCDPMDCSLHQAPLSMGFSRRES